MTRYILCFGLAIALGKLCLEITWQGCSLSLLYYGAAYLGVLLETAGLSRHIVKSQSYAGESEVLKE